MSLVYCIEYMMLSRGPLPLLIYSGGAGLSILFGTIQCLAVHVEQRRARLDLLGWATSDGAAHVLGAIPPQLVPEPDSR